MEDVLSIIYEFAAIDTKAHIAATSRRFATIHRAYMLRHPHYSAALEQALIAGMTIPMATIDQYLLTKPLYVLAACTNVAAARYIVNKYLQSHNFQQNYTFLVLLARNNNHVVRDLLYHCNSLPRDALSIAAELGHYEFLVGYFPHIKKSQRRNSTVIYLHYKMLLHSPYRDGAYDFSLADKFVTDMNTTPAAFMHTATHMMSISRAVKQYMITHCPADKLFIAAAYYNNAPIINDLYDAVSQKTKTEALALLLSSPNYRDVAECKLRGENEHSFVPWSPLGYFMFLIQ